MNSFQFGWQLGIQLMAPHCRTRGAAPKLRKNILRAIDTVFPGTRGPPAPQHGVEEEEEEDGQEGQALGVEEQEDAPIGPQLFPHPSKTENRRRYLL